MYMPQENVYLAFLIFPIFYWLVAKFSLIISEFRYSRVCSFEFLRERTIDFGTNRFIRASML